MNYNVIFVHLLNDFSGSPKVLKETIGAVAGFSDKIKLYLGSSGEGFLANFGISTTLYWYHRTGHRILTLFTYFLSQAILLVKLLSDRTIDKDAVIFINTLLPFGAALYGKLTDRKVIYHVHEISVTPKPLKILLTGIARMTSSLNLYVSQSHMAALPIQGVSSRCIYNSLDADFVCGAAEAKYGQRHNGAFNVLMIASLRDYKGIPELLSLASSLHSMDGIHFDLVVNDKQQAISRYFADKTIPENLIVHPRTNDTTSFYQKASVVLNLSRVDQWVETFGLTILEAMAFGIPVIVPPVGGPAELVEDGVQGYLVNSYATNFLHDRLMTLVNDEALCLRMSEACRKRADDFSPEVFAHNIRSVFQGF